MGIALEDIKVVGFMCIQITIFYNKTKTTDEITLELFEYYIKCGSTDFEYNDLSRQINRHA